jgi:phosphate:Na+ symporter
MADVAVKMVEDSVRVFDKKDVVLRKRLMDLDDEVDKLAELITPYLIQLSHEEMSEALLLHQNALLCAVNELEHVGDVVSKNLMEHAKKQIDNGLVFSQEGLKDIVEFHGFVLASLRISVAGLTTRDAALARDASERREQGLNMAKQYEARHLSRLKKGLKETIETSTIHLDIISDYERINFHASEIGKAVQ